MHFRLLLAVMVAGLLSVTGIASAQITTDTTGTYTSTVPTATQPTTTEETPTVASEQSNAAPAVAAQPAGSAPSDLAFTGAEPLAVILAGLTLGGAAVTLLVRDRRRQSQGR